MTAGRRRGQRETPLIERAGVSDALAGAILSDEAWIDVIHRMDAVYADLVRNQLEVEEKNAALEEAQQFIDSVLAAMTDVLVACDIDGRIARVNSAAERALGVRGADLHHKPLRAIFAAASRDFADELPARMVHDGAVEDVEAALEGSDGSPVPLAVNCAPRYDHAGRLVGFVLIGRPVGELRRAFAALDQAHRNLTRTQQQLIAAEKMAALGQLVAGVAHELNNPISFVFGNLHALKRYDARLTAFCRAVEEGADRAKLAELHESLGIRKIIDDIAPLVEGTLEGAERVSEIVQDLRRFSSSQKEPPESFNLVRTVQTAAQWVTKSARGKPAVTISPKESIEVRGLRRSVHQIVVNLVQNAVDVLAGRKDGVIAIACGIERDTAFVRVADNGPGIRPDHLTRVFEPFFTTKPVGEGTGLGLYVSYNLAEELGGRLDVANRAAGGAEFTLTFPMRGSMTIEPAAHRKTLLWLQSGGCGGCTLSLLCAEGPDLVAALDAAGIEVLWHPSLSMASGREAIALFERILAGEQRLDILCLEGAVMQGPDGSGRFHMLAGTGKPMMRWIAELAAKAAHVVAVGSCAAYGGITAAGGNQAEATGLVFDGQQPGGLLGEDFRAGSGAKVVNIAGCPTHPNWVTETLHAIALDAFVDDDADRWGRPRSYADHLVHHGCPRNEYYEFKASAARPSDLGCMMENMGCLGTQAHADCNRRLWNGEGSCLRGGYACINCTAPGFEEPGHVFTETPKFAGIPVGLPSDMPKAWFVALASLAKAATPTRLRENAVADHVVVPPTERSRKR